MRHIATFDLRLRPFNEYEGAPALSIRKPDMPGIRVMEKLPVITETGSGASLAEIHALEDAMAELPTRMHLEAEHHFAPGVYLRPLRIPAGACATGRMHIMEHLSILAEGSIKVWTDSGVIELTAPAIVRALPGTKRAVLAITDCTWITAHPNPDNEIDPEKLEARFTMPDREVIE